MHVSSCCWVVSRLLQQPKAHVRNRVRACVGMCEFCLMRWCIQSHKAASRWTGNEVLVRARMIEAKRLEYNDELVKVRETIGLLLLHFLALRPSLA